MLAMPISNNKLTKAKTFLFDRLRSYTAVHKNGNSPESTAVPANQNPAFKSEKLKPSSNKGWSKYTKVCYERWTDGEKSRQKDIYWKTDR